MKKQITVKPALFVLMFLWFYAGLTKLLDYNLSRAQMSDQVFLPEIADLLTWLVPVMELITGILIWVPNTTRYGLVISLLLLITFTLYISGGLLNLYLQRPCACGGVIRHLSWEWHFVFNVFFLGLNAYLIILNRQQRRDRQVNT